MSKDTLREEVRQALQQEAETLVQAAMELAAKLKAAGSPKEAEQAFRAQLMAVGGRMLARVLERSDSDLCQTVRQRGHSKRDGTLCQGKLKSKGRKGITIRTLLGVVRLKRWTGACQECRRIVGTADEVLEVSGGLSAACASAVALTGVTMSFEQAGKALEELVGVEVDDNRVQRTVAAVAPRAEAFTHKILSQSSTIPLPPKGTRIYIMIDGGRIRMREEGRPWREPVTALVLWENPDGSLTKHGISHPADKDHVLSVLDAWMKRLEPGTDWEVLVVADGAEWIWAWADQYPWVIGILDYYHVKEHVWEAANELQGEGSPQAAAWVKQIMDRLWRGWVPSTVQKLDEMRPRGRDAPAKRDALNALATYLENHDGLIKFGEDRNAGRTIGSGAIESFCKQLFSMRMKGPGMFWGPQGARNVMDLRTHYLTGHWEELWRPLRQSA